MITNSNNCIKPINKEYAMIKDQFHLYELLGTCWCIETCAPRLRSKWNDKNKTCGQCSITSFLVQDIFGGEVYGINTSAGIHCFNKVNDIIFDLTSDQFKNANDLVYTLDNPQERSVQFADEDKYNRYLLLKDKLKQCLQNII